MNAIATPQASAAVLMAELPILEREVALMERAIALHDRREDLKRQMEARGMAPLSSAATKIELLEVVAARHGLTAGDLIGRGREPSVVRARQEAMHVLYERRYADGTRRWTTTQIGQFLGGRDHSTVVMGIRRHLGRAA
ncbi:chromosomal replication initiator DnaA [Synechococcus phage Ssp-JY42]|nr:hypothetical protein [Synechococcus phage Yong-M4-211]